MMKTEFCKIVYSVNEFNQLSEFDPGVGFLMLKLNAPDEIHQISLSKIPNTIRTICSFQNPQINNNGDNHPTVSAYQYLFASEYFDFIDIPYNHPEIKTISQSLSPDQLILSWRDSFSTVEHLEKILLEIITTKAAFWIIEAQLSKVHQGYSILKIAEKNRIPQLLIHGSGPSGLWTQIYQYYQDKKIAFYHDPSNGQGYLTLEKWQKDYCLDDAAVFSKIYGIVGSPVYNSLSPRIHNHFYQKKGKDYLYLPFQIDDFEDFKMLLDIHEKDKEKPFRLAGFTMVSPFKEATFNYAAINNNSNACTAHATNILVKDNEKWVADSSDGYGVFSILLKEEKLRSNLKVAVFGCGGAGRTIAATLKSRGMQLHLFNRSTNRGVYAAATLGIQYDALSLFNEPEFDIVVNATPLGKQGEPPPFDLDLLHNDVLIIDLAYSAEETPLVRNARLRGIKTYSGKDILKYQVSKQIEVLTGIKTSEAEIGELLEADHEIIQN